jgi:exopolysaccharide biosynthesis predicted pyruvyltransferase EpsI
MIKVYASIILILCIFIIILLSIIGCYEIGYIYKNYPELDLPGYLLQHRNKHIIYIPNPGNAGDALIAHGTFKLFDRIGMDYEIGDIDKKYENSILFYAGGGNLVGLYGQCKKFIENNMNNNEIVLLPHTIKDVDKLIRSLGENITIICREVVSYNYVKRLSKYKNNIFLSKDMAFYIVPPKYNSIGKGILNCYREDIEKTLIIIPSDNIDLSDTLNVSDNNITYKEKMKKISMSIFEYISEYETVNTNRLHMSIAGSLLNKNVNMYSNSYYKLKSVYDYSIKNTFKNTHFNKV